MTEIELEQAINQAYKDANIVNNSQVSVVVVEARNRTVEILGSVAQPGLYAIPNADFRLLNALVLAKDTTTPLIEYIYVIRQSESHRPASSTTRPIPNIREGGAASPAKGPTSGPAGPTKEDITPPKSDAGGQDAPLKMASGNANRPLTLLADAPSRRVTCRADQAPAPAATDAAASVASHSNGFVNSPETPGTSG